VSFSELFQWIKRCLKKFAQMCLHEFLQWKDFEVLVFLCGIQPWPKLECAYEEEVVIFLMGLDNG